MKAEAIGTDTSSAPPAPKAPKPVASPIHVVLADNLDKVIGAAPILQNHPDLAHAAATSSGNIIDAAQGIAGMHLLHTALHATFDAAQQSVENEAQNPRVTDNRKPAVAPTPQPQAIGLPTRGQYEPGGNQPTSGFGLGSIEKGLKTAATMDYATLKELASGHAAEVVANQIVKHVHGALNGGVADLTAGFHNGPTSADANQNPMGIQTAVHDPGAYPALVLKTAMRAMPLSALQDQYKTYEYILKHQGPAAAARYASQLAVSYAAAAAITHDPGAGIVNADSAVAAIKDTAASTPDIATAVADATPTATTAAEEIGNAQKIGTITDALTAAKTNVTQKLGLDTVSGVLATKTTAGDITQMISDEFARIMEDHPEVKLGENLQAAADKVVSDAGNKIGDQLTSLRPFRQGAMVTQVGERFGGKALSGVGTAVGAITKAMDSKTLALGGIAGQEFIKSQYAQEFAAARNENTIGQSIFGKNTALSGMTDFIVAMVEPQFMVGRSVSAEQKAADSVATIANLDHAFSNSPRYMNALRIMKGKSAGEIQRLFTGIDPKLAEAVAGMGKDSSIKDIHELFKGIVESADYTDPMRIPRMGLYGQLKAAKLSDSKLAAFFTHAFTSMPTVIDHKLSMSSTVFSITDRNALPAIGNMLASCGIDAKAIKMTLDGLNELLARGDIIAYSAEARAIFKNALQQSILDSWDKEMMRWIKKGLPSMTEFANLSEKVANDGLSGEERAAAYQALDDLTARLGTHEGVYSKIRESITNYVNELVRWDGPGLDQNWGSSPTGTDVSKVAMGDGKNEIGAAILFNERGDLHFVNYREMAQEFRKLLSGFDPQTGYINKDVRDFMPASKVISARLAHRFFSISDFANMWVNQYFFKPLALLTPGWALRVSASEAALNTARLGPVTMVAGFAGADLRKQIERATRTADRIAATKGTTYATAAEIDKQLWAALDRDTKAKLEQDPTLSDSMVRALVPPPRAQKMMTTDGVHGILRGYGIEDVPRAVARNIALFVRGMIAGFDKDILRTLGHEALIKDATYLAFMHDAWLPGTVDSRHAYIDETIDTPTNNAKIVLKGGRDKVKTSRVAFGKDYQDIKLEHSGYYEAWRQNALRYATDDQLGQPLAKAYLDLYNQGLRGQELHDAVVQEGRKILDSIPEAERASMERNTSLSVPRALIAQHDHPLDSWSEAATVRLEGIIKGKGAKDDYINAPWTHLGLLRAMTNQDVPQTTAEFIDKYGMRTLDDGTKVKFHPEEVAASHVGRDIQQLKIRNLIQEAATWGHEKALGKIVNWLSRQPVYVIEFHEARKQLQDLVDKEIYTADQANVQAQVLATEHMIRYVHNPLDKTRFEENMRVVAPFYFAQNQAWRRMGRLFSVNPGAFMQYMASMLAVTNWVSKTTAANGISLFNIPRSALMFGIPFTGSLSSLQTIDPFADPSDTSADSTATQQGIQQILFGMFAPKFGPIVTVPAHVVLENKQVVKFLGAKHDSALQNLTMGPIGSQTPLWESAMPNSILRSVGQLGAFAAGWNAFGVDTALIQAQQQALASLLTERYKTKFQELLKHESYSNAIVDLNNYEANQINKNNIGEYNSLVQQSRHMAMELWLGKIAITMGSPVSIGVGEYDTKGRALYRKFQEQYSSGANPYAGDDKFYLAHPDLVALMIGNTSSTLGNYIPETKPVYEAITNNPEAVQKYPLAAWAYIGGVGSKDTAYYQPAVTAELNAGLRQRNMPTDFMDHLSKAIGNYWYYDLLKPVYEKYKKEGVSGSVLYNWEQGLITNYGNSYNPLWLNDFNSHASSNQAIQGWDQLQKMMVDPQYAHSPITAGLEDFKQNYYPMLQDYLAQAAKPYSAVTYSEVKTWWTETAIPYLLKQYPYLKPAAMSVLINLG